MSDKTIHIDVYLKKMKTFLTLVMKLKMKTILKERFKLMKKKILVIPNNIDYKINCLIKYIEKNEEYYYGIRTIYLV